MRWAYAMLGAHAAATVFGLAGLLYAIPDPSWWADSPLAAAAFPYAVAYGGTVHILFGTLAVLLFGFHVIGRTNTLIFFAAAVGLSLGMELLGTGTGWPFGAYEYTTGLGYQVLDRVPFTVPLSWFYMGLTSYLLAEAMLSRLMARPRGWAIIALGAWLLTAWDLVLDPAMAHPSLAVRFWVWHETGPYMDMPLINFAGWAVTAMLFMGISRALWHRPQRHEQPPVGFLVMVYLLNLGFGIGLAASIPLWLPILLALLLGGLPVLMACRRAPAAHPSSATT